MTIAEILAADKDELVFRLVCIKNVRFTGRTWDRFSDSWVELSQQERIFAPGTGGLNFPQSREINDGTGSMSVSTSEFARFASFPLPPTRYVGNITAIVGFYNNIHATPEPRGEAYYQLTLRTLGDLGSGFDEYLSLVNYNR